jgi:hypothetical protein
MMPSKTKLSVDAKHSRAMYLTKALCSNVQSYGGWPFKAASQRTGGNFKACVCMDSLVG